MSKLRKTLLAATLGSLALGGGILTAQPSGDEAPTPETTAPVEKESTLTPAEMQQQGDSHLAAMQDVLVRIVELQKVARKQKDVIKLNCVNDKLLQVKQLLNIAEGGKTDLVEAIAQDDREEMVHQFSQMSIAKEKSETLRNEAEGCIGEDLVFLGPTEVSVDDPGLPDDPTASDGFDWDQAVEPPAYASPFL